MVEEACKDLAGVSASQVEMQSGIQFYDGITTAEDSGDSDSFCF
jgi:ribonucleoside-diphosphate reductase alpha chain